MKHTYYYTLLCSGNALFLPSPPVSITHLIIWRTLYHSKIKELPDSRNNNNKNSNSNAIGSMSYNVCAQNHRHNVLFPNQLKRMITHIEFHSNYFINASFAIGTNGKDSALHNNLEINWWAAPTNEPHIIPTKDRYVCVSAFPLSGMAVNYTHYI